MTSSLPSTPDDPSVPSTPDDPPPGPPGLRDENSSTEELRRRRRRRKQSIRRRRRSGDADYVFRQKRQKALHKGKDLFTPLLIRVEAKSCLGKHPPQRM